MVVDVNENSITMLVNRVVQQSMATDLELVDVLEVENIGIEM